MFFCIIATKEENWKKLNKLSGGQYRGESPPVALNFRVYLQSLDPDWDLQRVVGGPKKGQRVLKHHHTTVYEVKYVNPTSSKQKQEKLEKKILEIEDNMKRLIKEEVYMKEIQAIIQMRKNPKFFYSYVKKSQKTQTKIGPLQDQKGDLNTEPEIKANLLQDQYIRVFSKPENAKPESEYKDKCDAEISDISISIKDVKDAIKDIPSFALQDRTSYRL